jgi:hypothetical protein
VIKLACWEGVDGVASSEADLFVEMRDTSISSSELESDSESDDEASLGERNIKRGLRLQQISVGHRS